MAGGTKDKKKRPSPIDAQVVDAAMEQRPRSPLLAAILSSIGIPLGQVYAGRFRRSIVLLLAGAVLYLLMAVILVSTPFDWIVLGILLAFAVGYPIFLVIDAFIVARQERYSPKKRYQRLWFYILACVVFLAANEGVMDIIRAYIGEPFLIPSESMSPTLLAGDYILVDKLGAGNNCPKRDQIVVYRPNGPDSPYFVTRVVGLPGETISIKNDEVFINDQKWDDRHAKFDDMAPPGIVDYGPITIPADSIYVLCDNRRLSQDSRFRGPIPIADLIGTAHFIYWSAPYLYPIPDEPNIHSPGPVQWDRLGTRLD